MKIQQYAQTQVTLYLQNALDGMRVLPDQSFDLAIADPPYGASTQATRALQAQYPQAR